MSESVEETLQADSSNAEALATAYLTAYNKVYDAQDPTATKKLYAASAVDIGMGQKPAITLTRDKIVAMGFAPKFHISLVEVLQDGDSLHVLYDASWVCAASGTFACSGAQSGGFSWKPCNGIFCRIHGYERLEMQAGKYVLAEDVYPLPAPVAEIPQGW